VAKSNLYSCLDKTPPQSLTGKLLRVVESQEQVATAELVSSLAAQQMLEAMLEQNKPVLRSETLNLHYLLATPFRYPPLQHGSRFGTRAETGIFYGSRTTTTVFSEAAYYRLLFYYGMSQPPPSRLKTQHSLFSVRYRSSKGYCLHSSPFAQYQSLISNPVNYAAPQKLGLAIRKKDATAFEYISARDSGHGINVGLFSAGALATHKPDFIEPALCETDADTVEFLHLGKLYSFTFVQFKIDGKLPTPAI
tara:strand:+ start:180 stop:929 length:750 start_codon:yes stop_codon:yes gene_type:complete